MPRSFCVRGTFAGGSAAEGLRRLAPRSSGPGLPRKHSLLDDPVASNFGVGLGFLDHSRHSLSRSFDRPGSEFVANRTGSKPVSPIVLTCNLAEAIWAHELIFSMLVSSISNPLAWRFFYLLDRLHLLQPGYRLAPLRCRRSSGFREGPPFFFFFFFFFLRPDTTSRSPSLKRDRHQGTRRCLHGGAPGCSTLLTDSAGYSHRQAGCRWSALAALIACSPRRTVRPPSGILGRGRRRGTGPSKIFRSPAAGPPAVDCPACDTFRRRLGQPSARQTPSALRGNFEGTPFSGMYTYEIGIWPRRPRYMDLRVCRCPVLQWITQRSGAGRWASFSRSLAGEGGLPFIFLEKRIPDHHDRRFDSGDVRVPL